jgi:hypothetical protein
MRSAGQHFRCWPSGARDGRAALLFELHWREIAQRRVQPAPVVDLIDEAGKSRDHFVEALVVAKVNLLAFGEKIIGGYSRALRRPAK